jgi:hypothetical protein
MLADSTNVTWSVYGHIDDSEGDADIDAATGLLNPIKAGKVRVVAISKTNNSSYGAVDLVIQGKKFVKMLPIDDINLNSDEALASIPELEASGKLPTKVTLVYETGIGNATENIDVLLPDNYWFGEFKGIQTGTYLVERYVTVPSGYERPTDLYAEVLIHVNVPQTDHRLIVTGAMAISPINLSTDEHCVKVNSLYSKYFNNLPVTLQLSDGSTRTANVTGMYVDSANQFNGAVPGSYNVDLAVDLPAGLNYRNVYNLSATYAYWYDDDTFRITVPINVTTAQTADSYSDTTAPATTQTKITPVKTAATIQSVAFTGMPATVNYGDVLDLNQYVTVNTTSTMPSDQRVLWSIDGSSSWNGFAAINGRGIMNRSGSHIIRATSIVDATKYSEVTVSVSGAAVTGFVPFIPVNVTEDKGIVNFKTLFNGLKTQLPSTITATTVSGSSIVVIRGWTLQASTAGGYTLKPTIDTGLDYDYNQLPVLQVNLSVPQSDHRTVVTALQPEQPTITISEDKYANTDEFLIDALYRSSSATKVPVIATLQSGGTLTMACSISSYYIECSDTNLIYRGLPGSYILHLTLTLPDEFKGLTSDTMEIQLPLTLSAAQTARYNTLWVSQNPTKLTYTAGEMFDFSGIILMLRNTTVREDANYTYISADQLSGYNLKFYLYDNHGNEVNITNTALTKDMDGKYIHVRNLTNSSYTFFGPITVTD